MKIICMPYNGASRNALRLPKAEYAGERLYPDQGQPLVIKPDTALLNGNKPFFIPMHSTELTATAQLALRIGRMGRNIQEKFAGRYIDGIGTGVDIVAQNLLVQCKEQGLPWSAAYGFDGSAPVSAFFESRESETGNQDAAAEIAMCINGTEVQRFSTSQLQLASAQAVAYISRFFTLHTGDIVFTGSPCPPAKISINDLLEVTLNGRPCMRFRIK